MIGVSRSIHGLALCNQASNPGYFKEVSPKNNAPKRARLLAVPVMLAWGTIRFGDSEGWFNGFMDTSELSVAFLYVIYITVYAWIMRTFKEGTTFERFIDPSLSTAGSLYIMFATMQKDNVPDLRPDHYRHLHTRSGDRDQECSKDDSSGRILLH